jgi:hypothetical protein
MKRPKHLMPWGVLAVLASLAGATTLGQEQPRQQPSGTRRACCAVRICYDADLLPLSKPLVETLVRSPAVSGEPARRLLGAEAVESDRGCTLTFTEHGQSRGGEDNVLVGELCVVILSDDVKPVAAELLAEVCERLQAALRGVGEQDEARLKEQLTRVTAELERQEGHLDELRALEQQMRAQAGQSDLGREAVLTMVHDLETEQRELEVELAAAQVREQALAEQIAKIGRDVKDTVEKSDVAVELQKVIALREKQAELLRLRVDQGVVSAQELDPIQEQIALARAELAKYRESASQAVGGDLLADLNKQLVELAVESTEYRVRLSLTQARLDEIREKKLLEMADRYEREVDVQLSLTGLALMELTTEQHNLQRRLNSFRPPELLVIGSE